MVDGRKIRRAERLVKAAWVGAGILFVCGALAMEIGQEHLATYMAMNAASLAVFASAVQGRLHHERTNAMIRAVYDLTQRAEDVRALRAYVD